MSVPGVEFCPRKILPGKILQAKILSQSLFCLGKNYRPFKLGVEKYTDQHEVPEIFEGILPVIRTFVKVKFKNP